MIVCVWLCALNLIFGNTNVFNLKEKKINLQMITFEQLKFVKNYKVFTKDFMLTRNFRQSKWQLQFSLNTKRLLLLFFICGLFWFSKADQSYILHGRNTGFLRPPCTFLQTPHWPVRQSGSWWENDSYTVTTTVIKNKHHSPNPKYTSASCCQDIATDTKPVFVPL